MTGYEWSRDGSFSEPRAAYVAVAVLLVCALLAWLRAQCARRSTLGSGAGVLLVTAHPDDECMFFAPTILSFRETARPPFLLCLSQGKTHYFHLICSTVVSRVNAHGRLAFTGQTSGCALIRRWALTRATVPDFISKLESDWSVYDSFSDLFRVRGRAKVRLGLGTYVVQLFQYSIEKPEVSRSSIWKIYDFVHATWPVRSTTSHHCKVLSKQTTLWVRDQ